MIIPPSFNYFNNKGLYKQAVVNHETGIHWLALKMVIPGQFFYDVGGPSNVVLKL